jgi:hypothetical protein
LEELVEMNRYEKAPTVNRGANQNTQHRNYSLNPVNTVLERFDNPRISGSGWRVDCPTGHRSRGTLSVTEGDDGRALLFCHAGCTIDEILAGLGLQKQDLYIRQDPVNATPQQKREWREKVRQSGWKIALELLPLEILIVQCAAVQLTTGKPLNLADHKRLELASKRISSARQVLCES